MLGPGMPCLFREMFNKIEKYMIMVEDMVMPYFLKILLKRTIICGFIMHSTECLAK